MERPILLKAHDVRGILDGRQTQLRRIVKRQPEDGRVMKPRRNRAGNVVWMSWKGKPENADPVTGIYGAGWDLCKCPYGERGDRLWGRETWTDNQGNSCPMYRADLPLFIPADRTEFGDDVQMNPEDYTWTSSVHMPRWASRILLEIVSVRVERLQDISRKDAAAEGVCLRDEDKPWPKWCRPDKWPEENFLRLWDSIHGEMSHMANPWVWVVEFKRVEA
ncbi:ASCH domain-containing protein [Rhizobium leguminosarum]|uniref:hypothetical protein n=1 Tax=Rhizobium leguminosarum TaxID=384 RepID=UPI00161DBA83|nr:hypothetical protein [Rhizobium leguminosarum]MBB4345174.1 hypothetical protein [Rhizobium leguminosarum]MBB6298245.1 hypothetical protein [Rhizobium leguminosarum]